MIKTQLFIKKKSLFEIKKINFFISLRNDCNNFFGGRRHTPKKSTVHRIMHVAHDVMCTIHFLRGIPPSTEKLLQLLLII